MKHQSHGHPIHKMCKDALKRINRKIADDAGLAKAAINAGFKKSRIEMEALAKKHDVETEADFAKLHVLYK